MSVTQTRSESTRADNLRCSHCNTTLPPHATFCGSCGQRVDKSTRSHSLNTTDIAERYRIVSLVRRRPYVQLFLAIDNDYRRPVIIRDIDISSLDEEGRAQAIAAVQEEYDLLRSRRIPDVMPVIDLRYVNAHLYVVAGWPFAINKKETGNPSSQYYTLHDLLQSGIGIPGEEVAITWAYRICRTLNRLHNNQIVIGDLDPHAIVVSDDHYDGLPALMVSWLPLSIRNLLPSSLASDIADAACFSAPEIDSGTVDTRSDLYSLGAILYLLLTGLPPDDPAIRKRSPLPSPHELIPEISLAADEVVMRALALDSAERFQSAAEMSEALLALCSSTTPARLADTVSARHNGGSTTRVLPVEDGTGETSDDLADATISIAPRKAQEVRRLAERSQPRTGDAGMQAGEISAPAEVQVVRTSLEEAREEANVTDSGLPPEEKLEGAVEQQSPEEEAGEENERERNLPVLRAPQALIAQEEQEREGQTFSKRQLMERLSGILPVLPRLIQPGVGRYRRSLQLPSHPLIQRGQTLLTRVRHFIVGEQQHNTTEAALVEAPLRVQPGRGYVLRIQLMGRDQPVPREDGEPPAGLSGLVRGDLVNVEVRSALFQNYAYVVQRAQVQIPGRGYIAEVTIPMQALSKGSTGRRERFQIFFMDEERNPLYEKPFVIEIFVSPLVSPGREGHSVLNIPL
ncbi:MAG TPA: inactive serine/threonine-protein kinase VRK3 [Ktedonobacteraceae bacterium]|nr:inactive serine/threonine-protein kinase VRK3 [Ktedonobacteraceae bacterium]